MKYVSYFVPEDNVKHFMQIVIHEMPNCLLEKIRKNVTQCCLLTLPREGGMLITLC